MNSLRSFAKPKTEVKKNDEEKYHSQRAAVFKGKQPLESNIELDANSARKSGDKDEGRKADSSPKDLNGHSYPLLESIKEEEAANEHAKRNFNGLEDE